MNPYKPLTRSEREVAGAIVVIPENHRMKVPGAGRFARDPERDARLRYRYFARRVSAWARRTGMIQRPDACPECGGTTGGRIEAHHPDYAKPYEIEWLCHTCHMRRHR